MPKSAIDATRFTPTTPHASAKPPSPPAPSTSTGSLQSPRIPGPPGETPQQRVRRLREAAARARDAKVSGFDKFIVRGRVWADNAHRVTTLGLIGITAIAGVITVYALGEMIIHNRRKRREYFAQQETLQNAAVYEAQTAMRHGTATAEQQALLENEEMNRQIKEAKEAEKERARAEGVIAKTKKWLFEGLKREEEGRGIGMEERFRSSEHEERMRLTAAGVDTTPGEENERMGTESAILRAVEERKAEVVENAEREAKVERSGGMLDRLGTGLATSGDAGGETPKQSRGWMAFMSRR